MQRMRFPGKDYDRERGRCARPSRDSYDTSDFYSLNKVTPGLPGPSGDKRPAHWGNKYWDKRVRQSSKKVDNGRARKEGHYRYATRLNLGESSEEDDFEYDDDDETFDDEYFYAAEEHSPETKEKRIRPVSFSSSKSTNENFSKSSLAKYNYDQNRTFTVNPNKFKKK